MSIVCELPATLCLEFLPLNDSIDTGNPHTSKLYLMQRCNNLLRKFCEETMCRYFLEKCKISEPSETLFLINDQPQAFNTSQNVCELTSEFQAIKDEWQSKDDKTESLEASLDDQKNRQMRKTLVFRAFSEGVEGKDSWENCKNLNADFMETHLEISDVKVERAH